MTATSANDRYNRWSIRLHWLMFLLIAAVYATIELRGLFPRGSDPRNLMKMWHFMLGLSVLVLVLVRIGVRLRTQAPAIVPTPPLWQLLPAKLVHVALYLLMIGMPIAGWIILSAEGDAVPFFGLTLPPLVGPSHDLAEQVEDLHKLAGTIGYWLIGLHAAAALFHHYLVRDNTLQRMLPRRG